MTTPNKIFSFLYIPLRRHMQGDISILWGVSLELKFRILSAWNIGICLVGLDRPDLSHLFHPLSSETTISIIQPQSGVILHPVIEKASSRRSEERIFAK